MSTKPLALNNGKILFFKDFFSRGIVSGITLKNFGDFNASTHKDEGKREKAKLKIESFQRLISVDHFFLPLPEQKDRCWFIEPKQEKGIKFQKCDALFLEHKKFNPGTKIALGFTTGDCPIIVGSDGYNSFLIHSGLHGTKLGISGKLLKAFQEKHGLNPEKTKITIWGGICPKCYEVGKEWKEIFPGFVKNKCLDLVSVIELQLLEAGIRHIAECSKCSLESEDLFSFRGGEMERNLVFLKTII